MLLDDIVAGGKSIHINEGTLKGGCNTLMRIVLPEKRILL